MYMHYVCTYTEDNSKPEVVSYEMSYYLRHGLLFNYNKKYFTKITKILTTFRPRDPRVLGC